MPSWVWTSRRRRRTVGFYSLRRHRETRPKLSRVCSDVRPPSAGLRGARAERDSEGGYFLTFPADEGSFAQSTLSVLYQVVF